VVASAAKVEVPMKLPTIIRAPVTNVVFFIEIKSERIKTYKYQVELEKYIYHIWLFCQCSLSGYYEEKYIGKR
jgi:hypothetical protein